MKEPAWPDSFAPLAELLPALSRKLAEEGRLALVSLDLGAILKPEAASGRSGREALHRAVSTALRDLVGSEIRRDDLVATGPGGGGRLFVFLSRAREKIQAEAGDLEKIALRLEEFIYHRLFPVCFPYTGSGPPVKAGYGIAFHAKKSDAAGAIESLVAQAGRIAELLAYKTGLRRSLAVHDAVAGRKAFIFLQPVVDLLVAGNHDAVRGYEADDGRLSAYALDIGLAAEWERLCWSEIFAKALRLGRENLIFLRVTPGTALRTEAGAAEFRELLEKTGIEERRLVLGAPFRAVRAERDFLGTLAARFPGARLLLETDAGFALEDLPSLEQPGAAFVKIGRETTGAFPPDDRGRALLEALAAWAGRSGKTLVFSGVLDAAEARGLREAGFTLAQGPYYARAGEEAGGPLLSSEELQDRFQQKKLLLAIYLKRGRDYFHRADFDKAVLEFSKVIEIDPLHAESHYYRGHSLAEEGVLAMAVRDMLRLKEIDPDYPQRWLLEGVIAEKRGDGERALQAYQEYLARAAHSFDAEISLARERVKKLQERP